MLLLYFGVFRLKAALRPRSGPDLGPEFHCTRRQCGPVIAFCVGHESALGGGGLRACFRG